MKNSICIKGKRKPSKFEAEQFLFNDMRKFGYNRVTSVHELSYDDACGSFDMENVENWPVFE